MKKELYVITFYDNKHTAEIAGNILLLIFS